MYVCIAFIQVPDPETAIQIMHRADGGNGQNRRLCVNGYIRKNRQGPRSLTARCMTDERLTCINVCQVMRHTVIHFSCIGVIHQ